MVMMCPKCNSKTKVVEVRSRNNVVARKRECSKCKHKFFTTEIVDGGADAYKYCHKIMRFEQAEKKQARIPEQLQMEI